MSYLNFVPAEASASGKTKRWLVTSRSGDTLMRVSWYAPWRRYTDKVNTEHKKA